MTRQCRYALKQIKTLVGNSPDEINYSPFYNVIYKTGNSSDELAIRKYSGEFSTLIDELCKK